MPNEIQKFITFTDDFRVEEVTITTTRRTMVETPALNDAMLRGFYKAFPLNQDTKILMSPSETKIAQRIHRMVIRAGWDSYVENGFGEPFTALKINPTSTALSASLPWTPPPGLSVYFMSTLSGGKNIPWIAKLDKCYLFGLCEETRMVYKFPLPNIYSDGRLCLGNQGARNHTTPLAAHEEALVFFNSAPYNGDLMTTEVSQSYLFRFKMTGDGTTPIYGGPEGGTWKDHCSPISTETTRLISNVF